MTNCYRLLRSLCVAYVLMALCACVTAPGPNGVTATVTVVDSPNAVDRLYRYVSWNGKHYSAVAFVYEAQAVGVQSLVLAEPNKAAARCVAALAGALKVRAYTRSVSGNGTVRLGSSYRPVQAACDIGDGNIRVGEDYFRHHIARRGSLVVLDDDAPVTPNDAVARLRALRARSLVAARGSANDLLCFDAIARQAEVPLFEAGDDGRLREARVNAGAMVEQACTP